SGGERLVEIAALAALGLRVFRRRRRHRAIGHARALAAVVGAADAGLRARYAGRAFVVVPTRLRAGAAVVADAGGGADPEHRVRSVDGPVHRESLRKRRVLVDEYGRLQRTALAGEGLEREVRIVVVARQAKEEVVGWDHRAGDREPASAGARIEESLPAHRNEQVAFDVQRVAKRVGGVGAE